MGSDIVLIAEQYTLSGEDMQIFSLRDPPSYGAKISEELTSRRTTSNDYKGALLHDPHRRVATSKQTFPTD